MFNKGKQNDDEVVNLRERIEKVRAEMAGEIILLKGFIRMILLLKKSK